MDFKDYWNEAFKKYNVDREEYSRWLNSYITIINASKVALDLGSGSGSDTQFLLKFGLNVTACDFSEEALGILKRECEEANIVCADISKPLPFQDEAFDLIVADLSLHYFDDKTTKEIMHEIKRILKPQGHLIARVNSMQDVNHGAGQGEKIEENFYFVKGYNKRFFDEKEVQKYFSIIGNVKVRETDMLRYDEPKKVIEINAQKD